MHAIQHKRVIVDTYAVQSGGVIDVRGRFNHVSSTEVDIERQINVTFERNDTVDEKVSDGYHLVSEPAYNVLQNQRIVNISPANAVVIKTKTDALNRTISSLKFKPSGSNNEYECHPKEQAILLPYLCDRVARENLIFTQPSSKLEFVDDELTFWYDPSAFGDIFISTVTNGSAVASAQRYTQHGLTPRNLVVFEGEVDGLIPCTYNADLDRITCHPPSVSIHDSAFGGMGNPVVFTFVNPLFVVTFNGMGIAKPDFGPYAVSNTLDNELFGTDITALANPAVVVVGAENAEITLWLKRPDFRRGVQVNRDVTPEHRLVYWYGKQDLNIANNAPIDYEPTAVKYYPRFLNKRLGTNIPVTRHVELPLGTWRTHWLAHRVNQPGAPAYNHIHNGRHLNYLELTFSDPNTFTHIQNWDVADDQLFSVILRSTSDEWMRLPFPAAAAQHADLINTDETEDLVLFFKRSQVHIVGNTIRFTRSLLAAHGGANAWAQGRPYVCPFDQLTGLRLGGQLEQHNGVDISKGALVLQAAKGNLETPINAAFSFDMPDDDSEVNDTFRNGTKSLFFRDTGVAHNNIGRYWEHDVCLRRWIKMQYLVQYDQNMDGNGDPPPGANAVDVAYLVYPDNNAQPRNALADETTATVYYLYTDTTSLNIAGDTVVTGAIKVTYTGTLATTKERHVDDYLETLTQAGRDAEILLQYGEDPLWNEHLGSFKGTVLSIGPGYHENHGYNVTQPTQLRDTVSVTLREKLFGWKTVNFLNPVKLYSQMGEWYPLSLQDYRLDFSLDQNFSQLISHNQSSSISPVALHVKNMVGGELIVYVRSKDSENQENKQLERLSYFYPEIERFVQITPAADEIVVKCVCGSPIPDYFFIYIERLSENIANTYENQPPKVIGVSMKRNGQTIRIYDEGMSKYDLQDMTRRNSHPRADMKQLYAEFGGVFISRQDVGSLLEEQGILSFISDLEFSIKMEKEENTEGGAAAQVARYDNRIQQDTQTTVLFLYEEGSHLEGHSRQMKFEKTNYF